MFSRATRFENIAFHRSNEDYGYNHVGGIVVVKLAGATLNVGDNVYQTATANQVNKSTVVGDYVTFVGYVVGGKRTGMECVSADLVAGAAKSTIQAAQVGEEVLVQITGIAIAISGAIIAAGQRIISDAATAGRIAAGTTAGQIEGVTVSASTAADQWQKVQIGHR